MMETSTSSMKSVRVGQYLLIDDEVCKVTKVDITKSGKHGASKTRIEALGISDGKRRSIVKPSGTSVQIPVILKKTAQVIAFIGENVQLMDMENYGIFESPAPDELKGKLQQGQEVLYWQIGDKKILKGAK